MRRLGTHKGRVGRGHAEASPDAERLGLRVTLPRPVERLVASSSHEAFWESSGQKKRGRSDAMRRPFPLRPSRLQRFE